MKILMKNYVIDMAESAAVTVIATETRNLRALPFRPTEDQLTTGKAWEEWLDDIEREFRYFRIGNPADRKDAMIIYGGKEIARLEKSLPDPVDASNEYEMLRKKLNDYFLPKQNKHYARYVFLKMRPLAGEATIAYATRLREKAHDCDFGNTFDDRIIEHLIQTIENQHLIQKCIAKSWILSQFLSEAGQIEDISLQVHDMKYSPDDKNIARVRVPNKRRTFRDQLSSEEDATEVCRYCGYDRKHKTIEDCPAYGQKCHKCQKRNHFASVCKSQRCNCEISNQKKKIIRSINERNRMQKTFETDSSDTSDDEFVSKSAAHMLRIKTIKSTPGARFLHNEYANILDQHKECKEEIALMRYELQRHTGEIEMKLEQKLSERIVQMRTSINTEAYCVSNDKMATMQMKDENDNDSQRKSHMNEIIQPQRQTQNDGFVRTDQTTDLQLSCNGSPDGTRKEDSDWEDSSFIEGGAAPNTQTTRDKPIQRRRKKRKGKSHS